MGGFATAYFNGLFNLEDIVGSALITGVAAITFYKGFWKPTGVATSIENATSKSAPPTELLHPDDAPRNEYGNASLGLILAVVLAVFVVLVLL